MAKGFTFGQLATLILVIMGLTIVVVIAATQLTGSGGQLRDISDATNSQGAVDVLTGASCSAAGGTCTAAASCTAPAVALVINDCGDWDDPPVPELCCK